MSDNPPGPTHAGLVREAPGRVEALLLMVVGISPYLLFAGVPPGSAVLGAVIIVASVLWLTEREARSGRIGVRV